MDTIEFENTKCVGETSMAIKVRLSTGEEFWIPQSQINDISEVWKAGQEGTLVISLWFATQKGLV